MSDSISAQDVKQKIEGHPEFYLLKTADRLSPPYPLNSLDAVFFLDTLKGNGWTTEYISEKTVIVTAPEGSNIALFMARAGAA